MNFTRDARVLRCCHLLFNSIILSVSVDEVTSHWSMLLQLLKKAFPEGETLPNSFYETKKIRKKLGLDYKKIDAYPNDCILYIKEYANDT